MSKRFTKDLQTYIFERVSKMEITTVHNQVKVCDSLTETNCGFLEYRLRLIIKEILENELQLRQERAQSANALRAAKRIHRNQKQTIR